MARKIIENGNNKIEFDEYNESQIASIVNELTPSEIIPVIVLEILKQSSQMMLSSILIRLGWSVDKFQALIDCATQNETQYFGMNKKIKDALPLTISTQVAIREMPKVMNQTLAQPAGMEELAIGAGVMLGVGAAEFKDLISGAEMSFEAPIDINKLRAPLTQGLQSSIKGLQVQIRGSLITIFEGEETLCSIEVRVNGNQTVVKTDGLKAERLLDQAVDTVGDAIRLAGDAAEVISAARNGSDDLSSVLSGALQTAEQTFSSLSKATTTINLPSKIAGIVRGVCREIEQAYQRKESQENKEIIKLQQEIQNALECIACGTPRVEGQSCTSCGYPYKGEKLSQVEIQRRAEKIKELGQN